MLARVNQNVMEANVGGMELQLIHVNVMLMIGIHSGQSNVLLGFVMRAPETRATARLRFMREPLKGRP